MESRHRNKIRSNMEQLVASTNYDELMKLCVDGNIINAEIKANIEENTDVQRCHQELIEKITHRGPKAYNEFLNILEGSFPDAFILLQNDINETHEISANREINVNNENNFNQENLNCSNAQTDALFRACWPFGAAAATTDDNDNDEYAMPNTNVQLIEYTEMLPAVTFNVTKSNAILYSTETGTYRMESKFRGVAFIANIINFRNAQPRLGAEADRVNLITLFREMGFTIFYYEDLTKNQFFRLIEELSKSPHLRKNESFIFTILSHGQRENGKFVVEFNDHEQLDVERIISTFNNQNCPNLVGKPKIFIFPFCRGDDEDKGINASTIGRLETDFNDAIAERRARSPPIVPTLSDIRVLYGTLSGYVAKRHPSDGSYFITALCHTWAEFAHRASLCDLMKLTDKKLRELRFNHATVQVTGSEDWGFNQALFFNPGYIKQALQQNTSTN